MMTFLIQKDFFQLTPIQNAYQVLPLESMDGREEYRAMYMGKERVGFSFNALEKKGVQNEGSFELRHQTYLSFLFLGQEREMLIRGKARLDSTLNLQIFRVRISSGDYWTRITGQIAKNNLNLVIENKEGPPVRKIIPLNGPLFFSEALNFIWMPENLKIGKKGRVNVWNPLMTNLQPIDFHVTHKTRISYDGKDVEVYVAELDMGGILTHVWVDPAGTVLKEESPTGLTLKKEYAWQIFDAMRERRSSPPDLPNLYSVPSNEILKNPKKLHFLKVEIKQPEGEKIQEIKKENLDDLKELRLPLEINATEFSPYLEDSPWVSSKDPEITKQAKEIVGDEKSALTASLKILTWVHQNILPVPTMGIPQAREVLAAKRGDCNEYTVLFTALTRATGIPTKMIAGLVYQNGRFFYHAWPEVYLGRWIALDPTFGEAPANVTHITLVEGDAQDQLALVNQLGKIKIFILESK